MNIPDPIIPLVGKTLMNHRHQSLLIPVTQGTLTPLAFSFKRQISSNFPIISLSYQISIFNIKTI
ncbi:hypothetical protein VCRA2128O98_60170 [Vibrio crassostreae]|nr:hypothetical protein VCRA2126O86_60169 [Vibrio crassostreae]CAK3070947.1 hypothetical protein VCRA2128O106_60170 [Vibrio crassostreae]CAK3072465.1 hypothetical protein VCRA2127O91_60170 [Vibrio crassostreae]CAK3075510.1 hypothetical protein VCRA2128O100_60169 [Vibrio crassostreae]CAK3668033.1 hypothetical protein VCRA2126O87_60170 [Vibrio crassostreae]